MKTVLIYAAIAIFLSVGNLVHAKIWTVDNNTGSTAIVQTAQAAHDSASAGDTLYFVGSPAGYGDLTLTKQLFIFGPGYFLTDNPETQANPNSASIGMLSFNTSCEGSSATGMFIEKVTILVNDILVKRNYIWLNSSADGDALSIAANLNNIFVAQNYIRRTGGNIARAIRVGSGVTSIIIFNNAIRGGFGTNNRSIHSFSPVELFNNVFEGRINVNNSILYNNILIDGAYTGSGNTSTYNMGNGTQFDTASTGNIVNANMDSVFVGGANPAHIDNQLQLRVNSPAIGAGQSGVDMGCFGGSDPYRLSGLPAIPAIYEINAPPLGYGSEGLPVNVKIKSHN